ncbi:MAG: hypothetical protein ABFD82_19755, partial [Syntrophaceae bacterium]
MEKKTGGKMKIDRFLKMTCLLYVLACFLATYADAAQTWAVKVVSIALIGNAVGTVSGVGVIAPGQDKAQMRKLNIGTTIEHGAQIITPPR